MRDGVLRPLIPFQNCNARLIFTKRSVAPLIRVERSVSNAILTSERGSGERAYVLTGKFHTFIWTTLRQSVHYDELMN